MKISVAKDSLVSGLRRVMNIVSSRPIAPILSHVLLEADNGNLFITGTDTEVRIRTEIPALVFFPGKITLPAKKFFQIASALPAGDVSVETDGEDEETVHLTCQKAAYKIRGLNAADYPEIGDFQEDWYFTLAAKELVSSLAKVSYARSEDEARKILNSVLLSVRFGMLTVAATDGRRLALVEKAFDAEAGDVQDGDVILPYKTVAELIKSLDVTDKVKVRLTASAAVFETRNTMIISKLAEGTYPNYRSVIPESFTQKVAIPRTTFADVLNRVAMVVSESSSSVTFSITASEMLISARSAEFGEASEPLDVTLEGEPTKLTFNPDFLLEPLKTLECDQLLIKFNDGFTPVAICGDDGFLYILMPMRV